jgi:hypothetical protein
MARFARGSSQGSLFAFEAREPVVGQFDVACGAILCGVMENERGKLRRWARYTWVEVLVPILLFALLLFMLLSGNAEQYLP